MSRTSFSFVVAVIACVTVRPALSTEVAYDFTGTVTFTSPIPPPPFGASIPLFSSVSGNFVYDTASAVTHTIPGCTGGCTGAGYLQQYVGGFSAMLGDVSVSADEYIVEVLDNLQPAFGPPVDQVTIRWASDLTPALTSPLTVDSTAHTQGLFAVNLVGDSTLFNSTALPSSLNLAEFSVDQTSFFQDDVVFPDLFFTVSSLTEGTVDSSPTQSSVPEPSAALMLVCGLVVCVRRSRTLNRK